MRQQIQLILAPSILGLKPTGVEKLPECLLDIGLVDKIKAVEKLIEIPSLNYKYNSRRDPKTKCLNPKPIRKFSLLLLKEVSEQVDKSVFPLVLGGDCSILIGIMPGLKIKGNYGLIFLDAHADFYEPNKSTTGELADMDLAVVTGRGPALLTDINNLRPYVEDENVIHIGQRDAEETRKFGSQDIRQTGIKLFDLATIKSAGVDKVVADVIEHMDLLAVDGFWIHFDTDVIDDEENPAVDYRLPGGLSFEEAGHLLKKLMQTGKITGMSVTIFNPALDKTGKVVVKIVDCLTYAFN
jgi:arginase